MIYLNIQKQNLNYDGIGSKTYVYWDTEYSKKNIYFIVDQQHTTGFEKSEPNTIVIKTITRFK